MDRFQMEARQLGVDPTDISMGIWSGDLLTGSIEAKALLSGRYTRGRLPCRQKISKIKYIFKPGPGIDDQCGLAWGLEKRNNACWWLQEFQAYMKIFSP